MDFPGKLRLNFQADRSRKKLDLFDAGRFPCNFEANEQFGGVYQAAQENA